MINLIGAFIVTLLLAALVIERKQIRPQLDQIERLPRWAAIVLAVFLLLFALVRSHLFRPPGIVELPYILLDGLTLWVHEAGHAYFMFFGRFVHFLGGTLTELLAPAVICFLAHRASRPMLRAMACYWVGFSLIGISFYIADARARQLQLLGGMEGHDWHNMLSMIGLLPYDQVLAGVTLTAGWGVALLGLWGLIGTQGGPARRREENNPSACA